MNELTPEQIEGIRKFNEEFSERCARVEREHTKLSPARQKARDFVIEKKKRDEEWAAFMAEKEKENNKNKNNEKSKI